MMPIDTENFMTPTTDKTETPKPVASSQYLARWLPEDGGKGVVIGDWKEVLTAATLFMEMGANKIEIETVREMQPNDTSSATAAYELRSK